MAREKGMGNLQLEKSGRWTMRVSLNGNRFCRSTRTKDKNQAEQMLMRFLAPLGLGEHRLPLAEVWNAYVISPDRNELAPATLNAKRVVWMHFARWMEHNHLEVGDLAGITHEAIGEYLATLRANLCGATYNGRVCILREIFRTLARRAGIVDDPWAGVKLRPDDSRSRRELTTDELKRLLDATKTYDEMLSSQADKETHEWQTLFLIGIYTGLRLGDCCTLDWSSVSLTHGVIQLIPSKTKRHAHGRPITIPIHPSLGRQLLSGGQMPPREGAVIPSIAALYRAGRHNISSRLSEIFKLAHITTSIRIEGRKNRTPIATFHSLRHTFVSMAANAGVPLHLVQSIVGHESTAMTRHYYHESIDSLRRAVEAIPTF